MLIEILFKGERRDIYKNPQQFPFKIGDYAIVEAEKGEDLGVVNQLGSMLERGGTATSSNRQDLDFAAQPQT